MKLAKRILVAMLAVALLVSGLVFVASAEEPYTVEDFETFSEFYLANTYLNESYAGMARAKYPDFERNVNGVSVIFKNTNGNPFIHRVTDVASPENETVLSLMSGKPGNVSYKVKAPADETLGKSVIIDFNLCVPNKSFAKFTPQNAVLTLYVEYVKDNGELASGGTKIFQLDMTEAAFKTAKWNATHEVFNEAVTSTEIAPVIGTWYNLSIVLDATKDVYEMVITPNGGTSVVLQQLPLTGLAEITGITLESTSGAETDGNNSIVSIYDLNVYSGSFKRHLQDKAAATTENLSKVADLYNAATTTPEQKLKIAQILNALWELDTTVLTPAQRALIPDAEKYINETFAQELISKAGAIDATSGVHDRISHLTATYEISGVVPDNADLDTAAGITPELKAGVIAAREAIDTELDNINTVIEHSEAFITYMTGYDANERDYALIMDFYTGAIADNVKMRDFTYKGIVTDMSEEMAVAAANFTELETKALEMTANIKAFITHVKTMELSVTFGALYNAYADAYEVYNGGVIHPDLDNESHAELMASIAVYKQKEPSILAKQYECDMFNEIMSFAGTASSYTVLKTIIAEAGEIIDTVQLDYPGVQDSVTLYHGLVEYISECDNAAKAYIDAVNALAEKKTYAEKKAALRVATILKEHGDVVGVEGIEAADVAYAKTLQEISVKEANSKALIALVAELEGAETVSARRAIIRRAQVVAAASEDTYGGVTEAKAALAAAVEAFNADVAAENGAIAAATDAANAVAATVDGGAIFVKAAEQ